MRRVYQAQNITDAYLVKGLLEQEGIAAHVSGLYLQGGVGELPASGLVSVSVADEEAAAAERLIADFQNAGFALDPNVDVGEAPPDPMARTSPAARDAEDRLPRLPLLILAALAALYFLSRLV